MGLGLFNKNIFLILFAISIAHGEVLWYNIRIMRYPLLLIRHIRQLRSYGKTYSEIQKAIGVAIPKSSLSYICDNVSLPKEYTSRIKALNIHSLNKGRRIAVEMNKIRREHFFKTITKRNIPIAQRIKGVSIGKIALAMLCLGEASKYKAGKTRSFSLGNSDKRIILLFLGLLRQCYPFDKNKVRATVQCRADQDTLKLESYWQRETGIPKHLFYKALIDPRTKGKPTKSPEYRGVLRVDYFNTKIQLELECLANLIYNEIAGRWRNGSAPRWHRGG